MKRMSPEQPLGPELPVHPWAATHPELIDGKGPFYYWGPNYTVDPIIIADEPTPAILMIERGDNHLWALPGGFVDGLEDVEAAARREAYEETGIVLPTDKALEVYRGPVEDYRATRNAWPETTALLWRIGRRAFVMAADDAANARWIPLNTFTTMNLHGSHAALIDTAIRNFGTVAEQLS